MLQERKSDALDPVTDLLESRRVSHDFPSRLGKIRVETRIRISRPPWTHRTAVLRDGTEFQKEPLAPVEEQQDASGLDAGDLQRARESFARKALALHEDFCRQVQEDLAAPGGGVLTGRGVEIRLPASRKGLVVPGLITIVLALVGVGAYLLWRQEPTEPQRAQVSPPAQPERVEKVETAGEPTVAPSQSADEVKEPEGATKSLPGSDRLVQPGPIPVEKPSVRSRPTGKKAPVQVLQADEEASQDGSRKEETIPAPEPSAIGEIDPARYEAGRLRSGEMVYVDTDATFAEIPQAYEGLRCIRTADEDRTVERSFSFELRQDARVYVLHDRRIGKRGKPDWLKSFSATGEHVTMNGPLGSGVVYLDVFVGDRPAGRVVLGPNTQWSALTKVVRNNVAPKDLSMYAVCVDPR